VTKGNWLKFGQDKRLREELLGTGDRDLVEASPFDRVCGIGFTAEHAERMREEWAEN